MARNIWVGRMAIYYESENISTLRALCARFVLYCEPTELAQVQTVYKTPLSREIAGRGANLEVVA